MLGPDTQNVVRRFISSQTAAAEAAFRAAFRDGVEQACEELNEDAEEEFDCDWELILRRVPEERNHLVAFYFPAIARMSREITALANHHLTRIVAMRDKGSTAAQIAAIEAAFQKMVTRKLADIKRRLKLMFDGLAWAAAELGYGATIESRGRTINWQLDPSSGVEHCGDCLALAAAGPYATVADIGTMPGAGDTSCKARCRCHLSFA